jgi:hypothetical protein
VRLARSESEAAYAHGVSADHDLEAALAALARFLERGRLTTTIGEVENALIGCTASEVEAVGSEYAIRTELLQAALFIRARMGRVNDLIHASAIALALPHLLEAGEILKRPSLAAGNDPSRPYDVEIDRRIAEFKLARWDGHDAMRKRQVFKDFVQLAADESDRAAELYVLGERPIRFLTTTKSKASWGLDRAPAVRQLFEAKFGSLDQPISDFVDGIGNRVEIVNLESRLPHLFGG